MKYMEATLCDGEIVRRRHVLGFLNLYFKFQNFGIVSYVIYVPPEETVSENITIFVFTTEHSIVHREPHANRSHQIFYSVIVRARRRRPRGHRLRRGGSHLGSDQRGVRRHGRASHHAGMWGWELRVQGARRDG